MGHETGNIVEVGNVVLSDNFCHSRIDFLERQVANLTERVHTLEETIKIIKRERGDE